MERKLFIKNRFTKILSENLEARADELMERIKLNYNKEASFSEPGSDENEFDYVQEREICNECGGYKGGDMMEGEMCECGSMNESLKGGQKKLDKNKNNRIDSEDFEMLRKSKKKEMRE